MADHQPWSRTRRGRRSNTAQEAKGALQGGGLRVRPPAGISSGRPVAAGGEAAGQRTGPAPGSTGGRLAGQGLEQP